MHNTRVSLAKARIKWVAVGGVIVFLFITAATLYVQQNYSGGEPVDNCAGYDGAPSHVYEESLGNSKQAALICQQEIPKLSISVKNRNYITLQKARLQALEQGVLLTQDGDVVSAHISFRGKMLKAKVRLKGDWVEHIAGNKSWSLRVILSSPTEDILGRRVFSLQVPKVRGNDVELLYSKQLQQAGLMPIRDRLVEVEFNGQSWGLMEIEDHFTKELIEVSHKKESIIGRFDETDMWKQQANYADNGAYDNVYVSEFKIFDGGKVPTLKRLEQLSSAMMAAWQEGRLALDQIVDLRAYMRFIAVTEAWGGWHAFRWHNLRFYLNPYTLKFEPVPYDNGTPVVDISKYVAFLYVMPNANAHSINMPPLRELYESPLARPMLEAELEKLATELFESGAMEDLRQERKFIKSNFDKYEIPTTVDLNLLKQNFEFLKSNSREYVRKSENYWRDPAPNNPQQRQYSSMVRINVYDDGRISLANKLPFEVVIRDLRMVSQYGGKHALHTLEPLPTRLSLTALQERPQVVFIRVLDMDPNARIEVTVENPNTGQVLTQQQEERLWYLDEKSYASTSPELMPPSALPDWITETENQWRIPAGTRMVSQPLVVPEGVALTIEAGAHLTMAPNAYILVRGPLNMLGEAGSPVTIEGQGGKEWSGIYVNNTADRFAVSLWRHAVLRHIKPFGFGHFVLTGATNFYRSSVSLQNVLIEHVSAEDVINTVESKVSFDHLSLRDSRSDGFDSDYSTGTVENSHFERIGGDGIDTSGSQISVSNVSLIDIHDKAVSAGEASTLDLHRLHIQSVGVGVAAKDYSKVTVDDVEISQAGLAAIMAYTKKPEYGGAYVLASKVTFDGGSEIAICQLGSTLLLDGLAVTPKNVDVDYLYGEGIMKK